MPLAITDITSTERFVGTEDAPRQVLHVGVERGGTAGVFSVQVEGDGVTGRAEIGAGGGSDPLRIEVPLKLASGVGVGTPIAVDVVVADPEGAIVHGRGQVTVAEPGWTMVMVSHFHYDPVWWNTQASYTTDSDFLGADWTTRPTFVDNGFALVEAHLKLAVRDPDYCFVLAELDYLKPYFDTFPEQRIVLRRLMAEGRVELVGGTYNEPNTNLTGSETTIRNLVYGIGFQRGILGGDPQSAWQLDVFGHDPQFPGLVAKAGLTGSAWARGPHHQWGPMRHHWDQDRTGDVTRMQFESEFEWISPSGDGVLTHYMPDHYGPGWEMQHAPSVEAAGDIAYDLFQVLKPVAATKNTLLPVGGDYCPPNNWVTEVHRWWASTYVWPKFVCGTPRTFLDRVRAGLAEQGRRPSPQSRDMNPVYTGKDVSYIDTKQAQRAAETAATDAERLATLVGLLGGGAYPEAALDKVWRQLAFGAHHDAITGSESDQVYIDLLTGWREAYDLAASVRDTAAGALVARIDTSGAGSALVVLNTLSFRRTDVVRAEIDTAAGTRLVDDTGAPVPVVVEAPGVVRFVAHDVPSFGWRTYRVVEGSPAAGVPASHTRSDAQNRRDDSIPGYPTGCATDSGGASGADPQLVGWVDLDPSDASDPAGFTIENEAYRVTADPSRGGALTSVFDIRQGRELLSGPGNDLRVHEEHPAHPRFSEGPWHLLPTGHMTSSTGGAARVTLQESPIGRRLVVRGSVDGIDYEQVTTLVDGMARVDLSTRVLDHATSDRLLRVRFPVDLPGALPVSEVAGAVVGRGFALIDVDTADAPWTLDNPANTWFGLGTTMRVDAVDAVGTVVGTRAVAVAEIVLPDDLADDVAVRALVVALARRGVTATTSRASGSRYGDLAIDSNLPDVRILVASGDHPLVGELTARVGALPDGDVVIVPAARPLTDVWVPNADLRGLDTLPVVVVRDLGAAAIAVDRGRLVATLADDRALEPHTEGTVALLTYGLPGFAVDPQGGLNLSLMRSCTGWPSGVWIDPPRRTAPDGSSFQLQHWTHEFRYALVSHQGDWREATLPAEGQAYSTPLLAVPDAGAMTDATADLPPTHSLLQVTPERDVLVGTLKAGGNPVASGSAQASDPRHRIMVRLLEATGTGRTATLALPETPLLSAARADLLEAPREQLPVEGGRLSLTLEGFAIETVVATAETKAETADAPLLGPDHEPAAPAYGRYWMHNRGPAPMGFLPVTVAITPELARCEAGGRVEVTWVVASQYADASVEVRSDLELPEGWVATTTSRTTTLEAGGYARYRSWVEVPAGSAAGQYTVAARVAPTALGLAGVGGAPVVEDVTMVFVGDPAALVETLGFALPTSADLGRDVQQGALADDRARPTGLELTLDRTALTVAPGETGVVEVRLHNRTQSPIRGELQLATPWGTWDWVAEAVRGVEIPAGGRLVVGVDISPPGDTDDGHAWLMAKVMWFGRAQYSESVRLEVRREPAEGVGT